MVILPEEERVCGVSQNGLTVEPPFMFTNRYLGATGSAEHNFRSVAFDTHTVLHQGAAIGMGLRLSEGSLVTKTHSP